MSKQYEQEIRRRRTFAIISHPDAGKTTLTEKLLLYGGAIQLAGTVKGKKTQRAAVSDWMEIEKQRGISVTSSVMQFNYDGYCINILDTPGHQDFSEDTYRTLMAADSAVMVIDAAKGVERQTEKLFKVCLLRDIPIFTFINKMDRESLNPFDLLDDIEQKLGIRTYPMNWPIGSGKGFKGVYNRENREILSYGDEAGSALGGQHKLQTVKATLGDPGLDGLIGAAQHQTLADDIELLDGASYDFDLDAIRHAQLSPVFFGSALTNFGVEPFLQDFLRLTTPPLPRRCDEGEVDPMDDDFSAFVFKIQANMNKAHRDRVAFMRICSGRFEKNMEVLHVQQDRKLRLSQPQQILASEREIIEEAYAGDIIGVFDPGVFSIGDTLCAPGKKFRFEGIPTFAPEHFSLVRQVDTMKRKQFIKGTTQIANEGAIQVFQDLGGGMEEVVVGVVGVLQFEVFEYRLKNEYNVDVHMQRMPHQFIRWIENEDLDPNTLSLTSDTKKVQDVRGGKLLLFTNSWSIQWALDHNEGLVLSEFGKAKV